MAIKLSRRCFLKNGLWIPLASPYVLHSQVGLRNPSLLSSLTNPSSGVAYPGFTFDDSQGFEAALGGKWSEVDLSSILDPADAAAKYRGSYGMSCAITSTAEAYVNWAAASAVSSLAGGFWYKTGTYAGFAGGKWVLTFVKTVAQLHIFDGKGTDDNLRKIWLEDLTNYIEVLSATWYWLTFLYVQNTANATKLAIYDTTGSQVGATLSYTAPNSDIDNLHFGTYSIASSTATYFDEIYIKTTSPALFGPPTGV